MLPLMETLILAVMGGALFQLLHIPLAWMLGPMTVLMIWNGLSGRSLKWPAAFRDTGLVLLGYSMGLAFTLDTGKQIISQLPSMLAVTVMTILFGIWVGYTLSRLTRISAATGIIGSVPGGLTQMVVLSEEIEGTDSTAVTFMQTIRLLAVVFIVPIVAIHGLYGSSNDPAGLNMKPAALEGLPLLSWHTLMYAGIILLATWLAVRLRFPTPYLMGPMLASAGLMLTGTHAPHLPPVWILAAQLAVGTHMGLSMKPGNLKNWRRLLPYTILSSAALVFFSLGLGALLTRWSPNSLLTGFLGTAPGGMTEMGVTASIVHADLSMVVAYQMFRILFILLVVPPLLSWWLKRPMKGESVHGS